VKFRLRLRCVALRVASDTEIPLTLLWTLVLPGRSRSQFSHSSPSIALRQTSFSAVQYLSRRCLSRQAIVLGFFFIKTALLFLYRSQDAALRNMKARCSPAADAYRTQSKTLDCNQLRSMSANVCVRSSDYCIHKLMEQFANTRVAYEHDAVLTLCHFSSRQQALLDVTATTAYRLRPTQPSIPPGSVNKDQLRLRR